MICSTAIKKPKLFGTDDLKTACVSVNCKFEPLALILMNYEIYEGFRVVYLVDWEHCEVRIHAPRGVGVGYREYEQGLEQTFPVVWAVGPSRMLARPDEELTRKEILTRFQENALRIGREAQAILDAAGGKCVGEETKSAVRRLVSPNWGDELEHEITDLTYARD
jgi:hypothetical protein